MENKIADDVDLSAKIESLQDISEDRLTAAKRWTADIGVLSEPNVLYQRCFQLLKLGGLEAEIPRLVVFGQQSMGKTTLLDMIMGGPIGYSSTDTGTKMPVVIMLKPTEKASRASSDDDAIQCALRGKSLKIRDLERAMRDIMSSTETISAQELELEIAVPGGVHAVFVDLPGIKDDSKEGAELTRSVVRNYVQDNPNDLYVLVKKASDDPANWPWSLREFILSARPSGLGLTPKQTIVVGTRSKDFLTAERTDIRTQVQLADRVSKRAVRDHKGQELPLFLLELFSLSIQDKEAMDFARRKKSMEKQIKDGRTACLELLRTSFERGPRAVSEKLEQAFDYEVFRKELNRKFQMLLNDQLNILERRLLKKKQDLARLELQVSKDLADQGSQSLRESIKSFSRELTQMVTDFITGNFLILGVTNADEFLQRYGGTLDDNLRDGHALACELFPTPRQYSPSFLKQCEEAGERAIGRLMARQNNENRAKEAERTRDMVKSKFRLRRDKSTPEEGQTGQNQEQSEEAPSTQKADIPAPDRSGQLHPGQFVRYLLNDGSCLLGFVREPEKNGMVNCLFTFRPAPSEKARQNLPWKERQAEAALLTVVTPLSMAPSLSPTTGNDVLAWRKIFREDEWVGVQPVLVKEFVSLTPVANPWLADAHADEHKLAPDLRSASIPISVYDGEAIVHPVTLNQQMKAGNILRKILHRGPKNEATTEGGDGVDTDQYTVNEEVSEKVGVMDLFIDAAVMTGEDGVWNMSPLQRIAGTFADRKLINQVSITCLGRWLKFHIAYMEPQCRLSDDVLLQMMRGVKHVVDRAQWEPLVADLLQSNVRDGLLMLARLAACAGSVALKRILMASLATLKDRIENGSVTGSLLFLITCSGFLREVEEGLEEYCRTRAMKCAADMRDLIFDQTQAISFELIEDIFDGCRQFEAEFLGTKMLCDMTQKIREGLAVRKERLGKLDIYNRQGQFPQDAIYDEVRVHFWVVKMLLSAPMTTRLYIAFVKDIKDKGPHLADETRAVAMSSESKMEQELMTRLLAETSADGSAIPRTEDELQRFFKFSVDREALSNRLAGVKRAKEYVKMTLECVNKLRSAMTSRGGVDFLTRLEFSTTSSASPGTIPTQAPSPAPSPPSIGLPVPQPVHTGHPRRVGGEWDTLRR